MSTILNSLNAHNFLIFQPILMILVSKFMVYRAFSDKTYLSLGLRSPLIQNFKPLTIFCGCTALFVSELVGNPKDRFSHDAAHLIND